MRQIKYHKWSTHLHRKRRLFPTAATQPPSPRTRLKKEKERHLPKKYKKQKKFQKELIIKYSSHVSFTRITKKNLRIDTTTHHQSFYIRIFGKHEPMNQTAVHLHCQKDLFYLSTLPTIQQLVKYLLSSK